MSKKISMNLFTTNSQRFAFPKMESILSNSIFLKSLLGLLLSFFILSTSYTSHASHYRGGSITWQQLSSNTVKVTVKQYYRTTYGYTEYPSGNYTTDPQIGSKYTADGGTPLNFGDGTYETIIFEVTSKNTTENWFEATFVTTHTYSSAGSYIVYYGTCCRVSNLAGGNNDASFVTQSTVTIGTSNNSPVSSMPAILNFPSNVVSTYQIPAVDPDGDILTYSLAPLSETGPLSNYPSGASVSSTGLLTIDGSSLGNNSLWALVVKVKDSKGAYVNLDFMVQISGNATPNNSVPLFNYTITPPNGHVYTITPGTLLNFDVNAYDLDAGDDVLLSVVGMPSGATFTTSIGNPIQSNFSWTPNSSQLGSYVINFSAKDNHLAESASSVIINVVNDTTPTSGTAFITKWIPSGTEIKVPTGANAYAGEYNYNAILEDLTGGGTTTMSGLTGIYTFSGLTPGHEYQLSIEGNFPHFTSSKLSATQKADLTEIIQWGSIQWKSMANAFTSCVNVAMNATDAPDLSQVTDLSGMFFNTPNLGSEGNWNWNTSNVEKMNSMFYRSSTFNGDISNWNTGNVKSTASMFYQAFNFSQDLGMWNTQNITNMDQMFREANNFNHDLGAWNLSNLTSAEMMFDAKRNQGMDCNNFSNTILGWGTNGSTPNGIILGARLRDYQTDAQNSLLAKGWTIKQLGNDCGSGSVLASAKTDFNSIQAFPNPTDGLVNIDASSYIGETFIITDLYGRVIFKDIIKDAITTIDLSGKSLGMYFIRIKDKAIKFNLK